MNNILITGSAGFIGSRLFQTLIDQGINYSCKILCIDNLRYNQFYIANWQAATHGCRFYNLDISKSEALPQIKELLSSCSTVFHLAALVGEPVCKKYPEEASAVHITATQELVKRLKENQHIIFPHTNSQYGSAEGLCYEDSPINPLSHYAKTKCEAEKIVLSHPFSTSFRLSTVGGISARTRSDLIVNDWAAQAYYNKKLSIFDGEAIRNYIGIQDVCDAMIYAYERSQDDITQRLLGAYNVVDERANISKWEIAEKIKELCPFKVSLSKKKGKDPDQRNAAISGQKLSKEGFSARVSLENTLKELFNYFENTVKDKYEQFRLLGTNNV